MKLKQLKEIILDEIRLSILEESLNPGTLLQSVKPFRPVYMAVPGKNRPIPTGILFKVQGFHKPVAEIDQQWKVPNPVYPDERGKPAPLENYYRIRLLYWLSDGVKRMMFIAPHEIKNFREVQPKPRPPKKIADPSDSAVPEMPGEAVPPGPPETGVRPRPVTEWTADGRHDDHTTDNLGLFEVRQVLLEEI